AFPSSNQSREPRCTRPPPTGAPGRTILQPPRDGRLGIRSASIDADELQVGSPNGCLDHVAVILVGIQDGDVAEPPPIPPQQRFGHDLLTDALSLLREALRALVEVDR